MTHDKTAENRKLLSTILILSNLYEKKEELSFSEAYENSGLKMIPSFLKYMQAMERYKLIRRIRLSQEEFTLRITPHGRSILDKYSNLLKEFTSNAE